MDEKRIPWSAEQFAPEVVTGILPDGLNEYMYPEYPDLPYPDTTNAVAWYHDPLVTNDEPNPLENSWDLEDPENPWLIPYGPQFPPVL